MCPSYGISSSSQGDGGESNTASPGDTQMDIETHDTMGEETDSEGSSGTDEGFPPAIAYVLSQDATQYINLLRSWGYSFRAINFLRRSLYQRPDTYQEDMLRTLTHFLYVDEDDVDEETIATTEDEATD